MSADEAVLEHARRMSADEAVLEHAGDAFREYQAEHRRAEALMFQRRREAASLSLAEILGLDIDRFPASRWIDPARWRLDRSNPERGPATYELGPVVLEHHVATPPAITGSHSGPETIYAVRLRGAAISVRILGPETLGGLLEASDAPAE